MTKRVLLLVPEGLTFDMLTEAQQTAINNVFGQYVMPMPQTEVKDGYQICDALTIDSFNPNNMGALGLTWDIIAMWQVNNSVITELIPLDVPEFESRLSDTVTYDEEGNELSRETTALYEPHKWSGWPTLINKNVYPIATT